jgi:tetratricopeptide (TPR) repeat protein
MRRFLLPAALVISAFAAAQTPSTATQATEKAASRDYSDEGYVVEQLRNSYHFETDGTGKHELYAKVRVQSEAGVQQWGQVVVGYNSANEKIEIPYLRVLKKDGTTVTAPADAVQDLSTPIEREAPVYTDFRQKHITVPGLRPGDTLEYDMVTVTNTALAPGQFWMEHDFDTRSIVLDEKLVVDIPQDRAVKLKTKPGNDPKVSESGGRRTYTWTSSHLEREDDDKDKKDSKKNKKRRDEELDAPAVQMSSFPSWEELGRWYAGLEKDRRQPTPEVKAKADELTKGLNGDLDKTQALYDFVAKNFRYVSLSLGLGRYQPHSAADVLHNQYGDCKDKHTLLASLLEAEGIHASSVLINSHRKLDPEVPSPSQFDHVITMAPIGKEEVWMDTTTEVAPFRLLAFPLRDKQALEIPPGDGGRIVTTPRDTPMPGFEVQQLDGKVDELGKLTAQVHVETRGDMELLMRMVFRRVPNSSWQRVLESMSASAGIPGDVTDVHVSDPEATRTAFVIDYKLSKVNYFDWSKKKFEMPLPFSGMATLGAPEEDDSPNPEPIKLGPRISVTSKIKLQLPPKFSGNPPLPVTIKRDYAEYSSSYKLDAGELDSERILVVRESEIPAARYGDYAAFHRAVLADQMQQLSLENAAAGSLTPPPNMKADDLNDSGQMAMRNGNYPLAIELLKRAVEVDPKHKMAWNNLGLAYLGMRKNDDAIAAFKKQLEISPYDEYANNNLGRAYWSERKYDDAIAAFQKQLEINPLDKYAHGNLGNLYLEQKKYDLAAPELEKAASLRADDALLQINLGTAYLNLGKDDKALTAFDKAVEISATPLVWNNIAYELSLKKAHLDKAKQYAESAVTATAASLRNSSLDQLSLRDVNEVNSLVAYWDTLGWIYFVNNDSTNAEKYISAAWVVGQHADVGDHLGQIYEKQGKKDAAIRAYALSMNAVRPDPETRGRLVALAGEKKATEAIEKNSSSLREMRNINLGKVAKQTAKAEFFVAMEPSGPASAITAAKYISGDEPLKSMTETLKTVKYPLTFPDETATKVLRRGTMTCSTNSGECSFAMEVPGDVRSVD